jgi:hypothetical protein
MPDFQSVARFYTERLLPAVFKIREKKKSLPFTFLIPLLGVLNSSATSDAAAEYCGVEHKSGTLCRPMLINS